MKQYDKVLIPHGEAAGQPMFSTEITGPVIVLTLDELRELWDECREETWQDARPTTRYEKPDRLPGFEGYLQSKGIKP